MHWSPAVAWAVLAVIVAVFVAVFDIHAKLTGTHTMSWQFRAWLFSPVIGPFAFGAWVGVFVALTFHWFEYRGR